MTKNMTKKYMRRIPMGQPNQVQPLSTTQLVVGSIVLYALYLSATGQLDSRGAAMSSPPDALLF